MRIGIQLPSFSSVIFSLRAAHRPGAVTMLAEVVAQVARTE